MRVRTRATHLNGVHTRTHKVETTARPAVGRIGLDEACPRPAPIRGLAPARVSVRIELWRARIRTGCYQVNGHSLAACILIKEAHFFRL